MNEYYFGIAVFQIDCDPVKTVKLKIALLRRSIFIQKNIPFWGLC